MRICEFPFCKALSVLGYDGKRDEYAYVVEDEKRNLIFLKERRSLTIEDIFDYPAPRYDDAAYFLRDKYNIYAYACYRYDSGWNSFVHVNGQACTICCAVAEEYDDALAVAVMKAISYALELKKAEEIQEPEIPF